MTISKARGWLYWIAKILGWRLSGKVTSRGLGRLWK